MWLAAVFAMCSQLCTDCIAIVSAAVCCHRSVVHTCRIEPMYAHAGTQASLDPDHEMYYFEVCGQAFLWHQVRCMMALLFLVGRKLESPEVRRFHLRHRIAFTVLM